MTILPILLLHTENDMCGLCSFLCWRDHPLGYLLTGSPNDLCCVFLKRKKLQNMPLFGAGKNLKLRFGSLVVRAPHSRVC